MEKMLAGALRREQIAEASIKELKAEIEQLNLLVFFSCVPEMICSFLFLFSHEWETTNAVCGS